MERYRLPSSLDTRVGNRMSLLSASSSIGHLVNLQRAVRQSIDKRRDEVGVAMGLWDFRGVWMIPMAVHRRFIYF